MRGHDDIDHTVFDEGEVVTEADGVIAQEIYHLLLGEGGEEKTKLDFVVAVGGMEECIELTIGHDGVIGIVVEVSGECLKFGNVALHTPFIEQTVAVGKVGGTAAKGEAWSCLVAIDNEFIAVVFRCRLATLDTTCASVLSR